MIVAIYMKFNSEIIISQFPFLKPTSPSAQYLKLLTSCVSLIALYLSSCVDQAHTWLYLSDITMNHCKSHQKEVAAQCYSLSLKSRVLRILQTYALMQQRQATNNHLAQQFHIKKVWILYYIRKFWMSKVLWTKKKFHALFSRGKTWYIINETNAVMHA